MLNKLFQRLFSRKANGDTIVPPKIVGEQPTFTVISAVYNVGRYMEDFFESLTSQENFAGEIEIIIVDDGSTDDSAAITRGWQERFPNIRYIYKENGGQASARNLGLSEARGHWVTFIDPDDYVSLDYFSQVASAIAKSPFAALISTRLVFYHEDSGSVKLDHPLDFRYRAKPVNILSVSDLGKHFQMSAAHAFFKLDKVQLFNLRFDERVKPNFEDAKFTCEYLLKSRGELCVFLAKPRYFYRKRADASSTLDRSGDDPRLFSDVIQFGMIELMQKAKGQQGFVPHWLQRACLYSIIWTIRGLYRKRYIIDPVLEKKCDVLLDELFSFIDEDIIRNFDLAYIKKFDKIALLTRFKNANPRDADASWERIEPGSNVGVLVVWHGHSKPDLTILHDGSELFPIHSKTTQISLAGKPYVYATRLWFDIPETGYLNAKLPFASCALNARTQRWEKNAPGAEILRTMRKTKNDDRAFPESERTLRIRANLPDFQKYKGCWVFIDRDRLADDNAEHLYRYVSHNHPEIDCYFVLSDKSSDWPRLQQEGFNLIPFGSEDHSMAFLHCQFLLSSSFDQYIEDSPPRKYYADYLVNRKFVFLQHGVTKDDISAWFNAKAHTHTIVTTTPPEHESIVGEYSPYIFSSRQVKMTGMPRHDHLLELKSSETDRITIVPTWRPYLVTLALEGTTQRSFNPEFLKSDFFKYWNDLISSKKLSQAVKRSRSKLTLLLHPSLEPYIDSFDLPDSMESHRYDEVNVQKIIAESKVMITDYSSIVFDAAFINRGVIYFQFDKDEFYNKGMLRPGYFDFVRDGFGPVVTTREACLHELSQILDRGGRPDSIYIDRANETFPLRDGKNCERLVQHLIRK